MLPADSLEAAQAMEDELEGMHFWDGERLAAAAFATALDGDGLLAWDVYLHYPAGARWREPGPLPGDWAHQLGGGGAWPDPSKFAWGSALSERLAAFGRP